MKRSIRIVLGAAGLTLCAGVALGLARQSEPPEHDHAPARQPEAKEPRAPKPVTTNEKTRPLEIAPRPPEPVAKAPETTAAPTPAESLKRLQEGNQRWVDGKPRNPNTDDSRMRTQAEGQTPFAAVLTCADSRIPVERVFDCGVGDIFDVRVAGNIAGPTQTGSLEYGAEHLKTPLLVVMGHTRCGAVSAAATNAKVGGSIPSLIDAIQPAVLRARAQNPSLEGKELVPAATKENVWQSIFVMLRTSEICRERVARGELKIVGAVYNVADGTVEWIGEHPWQSELLAAFSSAPRSAAADEGDHK